MEDILNQIQEDIINLNGQELKERILDYHPYDVAKVLEELDDELRDKVLSLLEPSEAADIFEYLEEEDAAEVLSDLDSDTSSKIISNMELDDAVDIINELDEDVSKVDEDIKQDILEAAKYDDTMAGSIMTDNFLAIDVNMNVGEAMKVLVKESNEQEVIDILFVLEDEKLVGQIDLKDLIIARKKELIKDLMDTNFKAIEAKDDIKDAVDMIVSHSEQAGPV